MIRVENLSSISYIPRQLSRASRTAEVVLNIGDLPKWATSTRKNLSTHSVWRAGCDFKCVPLRTRFR